MPRSLKEMAVSLMVESTQERKLVAESVVTLAEVIRAAEELADTVEDHLYVEGDYREALVQAWRAFCGAADSCADPLLKRVQSEYWDARDRYDGSDVTNEA